MVNFLGVCDRLRISDHRNDIYWHSMIKNKYEISLQEFLTSIDLSPLLDEGETVADYISYLLLSDPQIKFFKSNWNEFICYFYSVSGFEYIFN